MIPPTSIDGTDITGATIDGTDVQEITVDGDVVFSAGPSNLPVAYSNLIAWYPFDTATYGGSNTDDVTAILGGSGDDTAYDGNNNGLTYQSSGGADDINGGSSSGYYFGDTDGETMDLLPQSATAGDELSISAWIKPLSSGNNEIPGGNISSGSTAQVLFIINSSNGMVLGNNVNGSFQSSIDGGNPTVNSWNHVVGTVNASAGTREIYLNGSSVATGTMDTGTITAPDPNYPFKIGEEFNGSPEIDGEIDDLRFYNKELSSSEVNQIISNTQP